ncbi:MAG: helix-turn-helix transcriptional regulator [Acidobacteriota bacterium]
MNDRPDDPNAPLRAWIEAARLREARARDAAEDDDLAASATIDNETLRAEVARMRGQLRILVQQHRLSQRAIEDRIGIARGYLSQILSGHVALKYRHVVAVLNALGVAPSVFFDRLYPTFGPPPAPRASAGGPRMPLPWRLAALYGAGLEAFDLLEARIGHCERMLDTLRTDDEPDDPPPN